MDSNVIMSEINAFIRLGGIAVLIACLAFLVVTLYRIEKHLIRIVEYCEWRRAVEGRRFETQFPRDGK